MSLSKFTISENTGYQLSEISYNSSKDPIAFNFIMDVCDYLRQLGFWAKDSQREYDYELSQAVLAFQAIEGLNATGTLNDATLKMLVRKAGDFMNNNIGGDSYGGSDDYVSNTNSAVFGAHYGSFFAEGNYKTFRKNRGNIKIVLGDGTIVKTIRDVYIRSSSVQVDSSGNPISETYEFIARDVTESDEPNDINKYMYDDVDYAPIDAAIKYDFSSYTSPKKITGSDVTYKDDFNLSEAGNGKTNKFDENNYKNTETFQKWKESVDADWNDHSGPDSQGKPQPVGIPAPSEDKQAWENYLDSQGKMLDKYGYIVEKPKQDPGPEPHPTPSIEEGQGTQGDKGEDEHDEGPAPVGTPTQGEGNGSSTKKKDNTTTTKKKNTYVNNRLYGTFGNGLLTNSLLFGKNLTNLPRNVQDNIMNQFIKNNELQIIGFNSYYQKNKKDNNDDTANAKKKSTVDNPVKTDTPQNTAAPVAAPEAPDTNKNNNKKDTTNDNVPSAPGGYIG